MVPGNYEYGNQYRGDTVVSPSMTFTSNGQPIDLTGATIKCQFRQPFNGKTILELTTSSGITVDTPTSGVIQLANFVPTWDPGIYLYDIEFTFPSGIIKTYLKGTINIVSDQTI